MQKGIEKIKDDIWMPEDVKGGSSDTTRSCTLVGETASLGTMRTRSAR